MIKSQNFCCRGALIAVICSHCKIKTFWFVDKQRFSLIFTEMLLQNTCLTEGLISRNSCYLLRRRSLQLGNKCTGKLWLLGMHLHVQIAESISMVHISIIASTIQTSQFFSMVLMRDFTLAVSAKPTVLVRHVYEATVACTSSILSIGRVWHKCKSNNR